MIKKLKISDTGIKIAKNTIFQLIGKIVSMTITMLIVMVITRSYGRDGFGAFSIMQAWPALFFVIVDFGLNAIAVRELTKDGTKYIEYLNTIVTLRSVFSLFIIIILSVSLVFFPYSFWLKSGIFFTLFLILTQALYTTTNIVFQIKHRYDLSTVGYLSGYIVIFLLALIFTYTKADIIFISTGYVLGGVVTYLINRKLCKVLGVDIGYGINYESARYLIKESMPLGLMFIFSQINFKADSILLSVLNLPRKYNLDNVNSVAVYTLPYKIFEVALVVPTFFMNSVFPVMVNKMNSGKKELKRIFYSSLGIMASLAVLISGAGILLSKIIINILGGVDFVYSVTILKILLAGLIIYFLTQPISWLIVTLGFQKYLPFIYFISAVFNFTANVILIPRYSFFASSIITHASELLILLLLIYYAKKAWRLKNWEISPQAEPKI